MNMRPFLKQVAGELLKEHGVQLRDVAVVLPSQRAGLYLRKWIAGEAGRVIWSPQLFTIGTFMQELSGLRPLANEELLLEGYEAYRQVAGHVPQGLNEFLQWGGTVLADSSEADAHLVHMDTYYRDLRHWENIEWTFRDEKLSPKQLELVSFWAMAGRMHEALNKRLLEKGAGTSGLIERMAAERGKESLDRWQAVWFVGLNAFTKAQWNVVDLFDKGGRARMAWDADRYYLDDPVQEAGLHLRKARSAFGPGLIPPGDDLAKDPRRIKAIRAPNPVAQAWCAAELLKDLTAEEREETAVVLVDEDLLQPLLEALPKDIGPLNITMGLSPARLSVGAFINGLYRLYAGQQPGRGFFHRDVQRFLGHPFLRGVSTAKAMTKVLDGVRRRAFHSAEDLRRLFDESKLFPHAAYVFVDTDGFPGALSKATDHALSWALETMAQDDFAKEQLFQASLVLRRVHLMLERYGHRPDADTYASLFQRLLSGSRIGFQGEPLRGVQVMGMLEARALDAKRLIVLGATEGILPSNAMERSYIPFELRRASGMPLREDGDAVQAYNFMRMLQRCEQATLVWPEQDEAAGPSRFIMQLQHELYAPGPLKMEVRDTQVPLAVDRLPEVVVEKEPAVLKEIGAYLEYGLSPSALGDWLRCPLDFYFKRVLHLKTSDQLDVRLAPNVLGNALHNTVEAIYEPLLGEQPLKAADLEWEWKDVEQLFRTKLREETQEDPARGQPMLQVHMAVHAIQRFLRSEIRQIQRGADIRVQRQEVKLKVLLNGGASAGLPAVNISGRLDRVDLANGTPRILDMKTGKVEQSDLNVAEWSLKEFRRKKNYAAQLMVYAWLYLKQNPDAEVKAGILPMQRVDSSIPLFMTVAGNETFTARDLPAMTGVLDAVVREMMDPQVPLAHAPDSRYCAFCLASE